MSKIDIQKIMERMEHMQPQGLIKGRAHTVSEKEAIMRRILEVWKCMPELRFGQMLSNVIALNGKELFYIEDTDLAEKSEEFVSKLGESNE